MWKLTELRAPLGEGKKQSNEMKVLLTARPIICITSKSVYSFVAPSLNSFTPLMTTV